MSITSATLLLLMIQLLSRSLGVVREMVIAWHFGASAETDAYFVAFSLPYAFYIVVGTSLTAVVVPLLAEYEAKGRNDETMHLVSLAVNIVLLSVGIFALGGMIGSSQIAWLFGGGFDTVTLELTSTFISILMPSILFMSVAGILAGLLNNKHIFGSPAFAPVAMNAVIILGAVISGAWDNIRVLVVATLLGSISFLAIQFPALYKIGYKHCWKFSLKDPLVKRIGHMLWPLLLLSAFSYLYTIIDFRLASAMSEGSITALNYSAKLIQLPQGVFAMAVTTAIFPSISKLAANKKKYEMALLLNKGVRIIILMAVPASVGLFVIGEPLIQMLFQKGAFGTEATAMTSSALLMLTIGLVGFCLNILLIRGFYALQDLHTPLLIGMVSVGVKLVLSIMLAESMQHRGLALATSIAILFNAFSLSYLLQYRLFSLFNHSFFIFVRNVVIAAGAMGGGILVLDNFLITLIQPGMMLIVVRVVADIAVGAVIYYLVGWLLGLDKKLGDA